MTILKHNLRLSAWVAACAAMPLAAPCAAAAPKLTTLYSFTGANDGSEPVGPLLLSGTKLYGVTEAGGSQGKGAVVELVPGFVKGKRVYIESTLAGIADAYPVGGLTEVGAYAYSVSEGGGPDTDGAIFKINLATGALVDVHDFDGTDGTFPYGTVLYAGGCLFGTTIGSNNSPGTLFKLNLSTGVLTTLHVFSAATDGATPKGALLLEGGILYGITEFGGKSNEGTVFSYDIATRKEKVLYSFTGGSDGGAPVSGLAYANGLLYGTAPLGGSSYGTVFSVNATTGAEKTLYSFKGTSDGAYPYGGVILENGLLYGTSYYGGKSEAGAVFAIDPTTGAETTLYSFTGGADGGFPISTLVYKSGTFFGTTLLGGASQSGTVFSLTP
jgi:uncharacterized repeat protein (TIGR03803 family)